MGYIAQLLPLGRIPDGDFVALWRLDFRQFSFNHIGQGLRDILKVAGLSYLALRRCYVHNALSVVANYVTLICILSISNLLFEEIIAPVTERTTCKKGS